MLIWKGADAQVPEKVEKILKSIGLVIPYFGRLPGNFPVWLQSCAANPSVDWLLFTDDQTGFAYPPNVQVQYLTFVELKGRIQDLYDFPVALSSAYKLCDFKVAYGEIFAAELANYDFWGFCDVDLVFGNMRHFLTDSLLDQYDKVLSRGHLSLFRNTAENNARYRSRIHGRERYKEVFGNPESCAFDEWSKEGINEIYIDQGIPFYDELIFADIYIARYGFYPYQLLKQKGLSQNSIFLWDHGCLTRFFRFDTQLGVDEVIYVHLQKRQMEIPVQAWTAERFLVIPNRYLPYAGATELTDLQPFFQDRIIYWGFVRLSWKHLLKKFRKLI